MSINWGALIIKGLAWAGVFLFLLALAVRPALPENQPCERLDRRLWTAGCGLFFAHVLMGFGGFYGWSHEVAVAVAAQATYDLTNIRWGGGLYANYLFTLVWLADALWWWINPLGYARRPRWLRRLLMGFMVLMVLGGTVLFTQNPLRWVVLAGFVAVVAKRWRAGRD